MNDELKMSVSPICVKNGNRYAFVNFADGKRTAEGKIPDCKIISNKGFSDKEVTWLEEYMKKELSNLKQMAAGINVLGAFMK